MESTTQWEKDNYQLTLNAQRLIIKLYVCEELQMF